MKFKRIVGSFLIIICMCGMFCDVWAAQCPICSLSASIEPKTSVHIVHCTHGCGDTTAAHSLNEDGKCSVCDYSTQNNSFEVSAEFNSTQGSTIASISGVGTYKIDTIISNSQQTTQNAAKITLEKYRLGISLLAGIGTLTMLLFFIINFAKLGQSAGNPQGRQAALMGILFTGIGTALLGSVLIFFQFFYNFI